MYFNSKAEQMVKQLCIYVGREYTRELSDFVENVYLNVQELGGELASRQIIALACETFWLITDKETI
uniref:Uncharacterized protein n=1 Tax=viral metagenome TaxID=1070528 RepID=A0A6M3JHL2_9ZZZZ